MPLTSISVRDIYFNQTPHNDVIPESSRPHMYATEKDPVSYGEDYVSTDTRSKRRLCVIQQLI